MFIYIVTYSIQLYIRAKANYKLSIWLNLLKSGKLLTVITSMKIIKIDQNNSKSAILEATETLRRGGLLIYPTETVYGVGVDSYVPEAVSKMLKYKNRPAGKAISVMVASMELAQKEVELNCTAKNIYQNMLPGPVTVISKVKNDSKVDPRLVSELQNLGIRISSHNIAMSLSQSYPNPITASSANSAGKARPYSIESLLAGLSEKQKGLIDLILNFGPLPHNDPSTVIDTTNEVQTVLRGGSKYLELSEPRLSENESETILIAKELTTSLLHHLTDYPLIFALEGKMGSGKTHFAKGVAEKLGVSKTVTSPTYNLIKEYSGSILRDLNGCSESHGENEVKFVHIDCWRADNLTPQELGLDQYLNPGTIILIEWAAPIMEYLEEITDKAKILYLEIETLDLDKRRIEIKKVG